MHLKSFLLLAALFAAGCATTSGSTTAAAGGGRDCFFNSEINGWGVIDPHTLRVDLSPHRQYALSTPTSVSDLDFAQVIAVRTRHGADSICVGRTNDLEVAVGGPIPRTWTVTNVARLPDQPPATQGS
ncbi:MAG TPA: DUF6491 family protein [Caulobacterales bacterium]|nr:DUF6491 family protein [Caulobacterales bacterium]